MEKYRNDPAAGPSGMIPVPAMKEMPENLKRPANEQLTLDEESGVDAVPEKKAKSSSIESRKIYIGNLHPSITEKPLVAHFRTFGQVVNCQVVRDRDSGISRGFAFLTYLDEEMAEMAVEYPDHTLDGKPIRVSPAQKPSEVIGPTGFKKKNFDFTDFDSVSISRFQTRVYLGPLDDHVQNSDITAQLMQYGVIKGVTKLDAEVSSVKRGYAFVDFKDSISVKRTFTNKIFIKGKHVKVTLSKLGMELILSRSVVFFYEAHNYINIKTLEKYFEQYGQVFRTIQLLEGEDLKRYKSYGFVDFISEESVQGALATKQQLINDQFVRVSKFMPPQLMFDLTSVSDKDAYTMLRKIEQVGSNDGAWGALPKGEKSEDVTTSQVRIPAKFVSRLIGERGKTITEICRDSKTKVNIPRVTDDTSVVVTITGSKINIKTAQYLMQKLLKGR